MPIYEYQCGKCGAEYEQIESSTASKSQICIKMCGGLAKRLMSAPSIGHGSNSGNGYSTMPFDQSDNSPCPIPEDIMKKVCEVKENSGANYIAAGQLIKDKLWAVTPIPDQVGEAMVRTHQKIRAAPNN